MSNTHVYRSFLTSQRRSSIRKSAQLRRSFTSSTVLDEGPMENGSDCRDECCIVNQDKKDESTFDDDDSTNLSNYSNYTVDRLDETSSNEDDNDCYSTDIDFLAANSYYTDIRAMGTDDSAEAHSEEKSNNLKDIIEWIALKEQLNVSN